jgi:hypothetical protein
MPLLSASGDFCEVPASRVAGRVPSELSKRLPELDGPSGRTAHQCHPNTKLALRLAAVEPNKIAHITTLFSREIR